MSARPCTICANPTLRGTIDRSLELNITNAGISRQLAEFGATVSAETIGRHKSHFVPVVPKDQRQTKRDATIIIKNKVLDALEVAEASVLGIDILNKDLQPALNTAIKAQAIQNMQDRDKKSRGTAELAFAIIEMLAGRIHPMRELEDGNTIEGEFGVIEDDEG